MRSKFWLALLLVLGFSTFASGATRYAAPAAAGAGNCTTVNDPCLPSTCLAGMADGDTCTLATGTYDTAANTALGTTPINCSDGTPCTVKSTSNLGAVFTLASGTSGTWFQASRNNWILDGIKVIQNANRILVGVSSSKGITIQNMRVEVNPLVGNEIFNISMSNQPADASNNINILNNWVHHYPGCASGPACASAGGSGYDDCDFGAGTNGGRIISVAGSGGTGIHTVVISGNDYGHWRNPGSVRNVTGLTYSKNRCTNATNHGCLELYDVKDILWENNISDIDDANDAPAGTTCPSGMTCSCHDEAGHGPQASQIDIYCVENLTARNNIAVGHGVGGEQLFLGIAPEVNVSASAPCATDGIGPSVWGGHGTAWAKNIYAYNNIMYNGNPSGVACVAVDMLSLDTVTQPNFLSDFNMYDSCSGGKVAYTEGAATAPQTKCTFGNGNQCLTFGQWSSVDVDGNSTLQEVHGLGTGGAGVPDFKDYNAHDYHVYAKSAKQVDIGASGGTYEGVVLSCPTDDFDGNLRTDGLCDIGAYEWQPTCDNDGVKEAGELCDSFDFGGLTCASYGFTGGGLTCDVTCQTILTGACTNARSPWDIFRAVPSWLGFN